VLGAQGSLLQEVLAGGSTETLTAMLGIDQDKGRRGPVSQTAASDNLADEDSSTLTASALPAAPTPLYPENPDDLLVVQEISKAERLVAYGRVNQAISMLKDVLTNKPDNIDVHIKLKDICLRTGMMAEAAEECGELVGARTSSNSETQTIHCECGQAVYGLIAHLNRKGTFNKGPAKAVKLVN